MVSFKSFMKNIDEYMLPKHIWSGTHKELEWL
jgi:hypothetical protein